MVGFFGAGVAARGLELLEGTAAFLVAAAFAGACAAVLVVDFDVVFEAVLEEDALLEVLETCRTGTRSPG